MRVLVPLPFDVSQMAHGRNLRIVHLLRELSGRCELTCATTDDAVGGRVRGVLPDVRIETAGSRLGRWSGRDCAWRLARGSYWLRRAIEFLGYDRGLLAEVQARANEVDVVLGFDLPSAVYLLAAGGRGEEPPSTPLWKGKKLSTWRSGKLNTSPGGPRTVCDLIDDPWLTWRSLPLGERLSPGGLKTAVCIRLMRGQVLSKLDGLTATAPRDAASLSQATGLAVGVVPNGVEVFDRAVKEDERELLAVFTGAMDFAPNESAACFLVRRIWPRVLARVGRLGLGGHQKSLEATREPTLAIVGANPTGKVQRLSRQPNVLVTGEVAEVSSWLRRARVAVAPMVSGCGMKNKVLEACAAGCPVVTTPLGAANLPTGQQRGIIVAESADRIAEAVAGLLADGLAARAMGAAGRSMVGERFSWSASGEALLAGLTGGLTAGGPARSDAGPGPHEQEPRNKEAFIRAVSAAS